MSAPHRPEAPQAVKGVPATPDAHEHARAHGTEHAGDGHAPATRRDYVIGFALSVLLTAIPFWLVMSGMLGSPRTTAWVIALFAAVQIVVHMVYFLHMNTRSEGGWSMTALVFTAILVIITLSGSLWVMFHLNSNMMPMQVEDAERLP